VLYDDSLADNRARMFTDVRLMKGMGHVDTRRGEVSKVLDRNQIEVVVEVASVITPRHRQQLGYRAQSIQRVTKCIFGPGCDSFGLRPPSALPCDPVHTGAMSNEPRPRVRTEPSHKRVRIFLGGEMVVDTVDALYVWENPAYPQYYLPIKEVAAGVLIETAATRRSPSRGEATVFTVQGGGHRAEEAAWQHRDSPVEELRDRVRFEFDAMDAWFEEDEEIFVHPRSPDTRIQILPSSRHITVSVDEVLVAESHHPTFLYETGLPRRTYLSKLDVRMDLLVPTDTSSRCPYKGTARYWSMRDGLADVAWSYPTPLRESAQIAGLVAFYDERVDVAVDGVLQPRPKTKFSH
jgi:uncharacterized protein (DUF427 family)